MVYTFDEQCLDTERRELRRGDRLVNLEPQVFDLLHYLVRHRHRVVTKEQLFAAIWTEKIVSESTLSSRIAAARRAIGDTGEGQRLIRTFVRKGFRFVADVREQVPAVAGLGSDASPPVTKVVPSAERRQLSIMNCRITEAPRPTATLDPEELSAHVAAQWRSAARVIEKHGGFVAHCTGESLIAYFGFPRVEEHDAERAVRAALAVVDTACGSEASPSGRPLRVAVGIATGLVVMDEPPAATATAPQAVGEAPFTAARMVALCAPCAVVIAASTRVHVGQLFEYRALGADRGEGHVDAFVVLGNGTTPNRFEALRAGGTRRIGRDEELALLERRWKQAGDQEGRVVLVSGEPGIGKSHLVAAFQETLRNQPVGCLRYFCSPHGRQSALHPIVGLLEDQAGIRRGDTGPDKLGKLERLGAALFDGAPSTVALLADLLAVPAADRYAPLALSAQRRKELLLELFVAQVARLATRQPVLVVVEDAHWIDPTTAEFLDVLVERVRHLRVLLLITHRPEFDPPWLGQAHVTSVLLNRLGPRDSADLVRQVAGVRDLPPALLHRIVSQADGIPLFLEEVTKAVLEGGDPGERQGSPGLAEGASGLPVPATVRTSLAARLERLAEARTLMQSCSALGREFSYALVRAVTMLPDSDLGPPLRQLVASGLVRQRGVVPDAVFAFKHALVQDAAYETMLRRQRVQLHRRIVEVLDNEFADQQALHPEVFAFHCAEAGQWEKAIDARIRAARLARDRSAGIEAQAQVEAAMHMLKRVADDGDRRQLEGRVQVALAEALAMTQGFASPDVMRALSSARKLLDEKIHPTESVGALCGMFNYHMIRSESPACLALARPYLRKRPDAPVDTLVNYLAGAAHLHLGNFRACIGHLESALASYDEEACRSISFIPGYHLRSFILIWLGLGRLYVGQLDRAHRAIIDAVSDARSRSHPFTLVSALLARARYCQHTLDLDGAIEATEEGAAIAAEQRSPYHASRAGILRALNVCDQGRPDEGITLMEQALAAHHATGANFQSSYNLSRLAQAHAQAGRSGRALDLAERAISEVERSGERWWQAEAWRIKGEILIASSAANNAEAERCFESALTDARLRGASLWELQAAQSLATLWAATGRRAQAAALLSAVLVCFREDPPPRVVVAAKEALGRIVP